VRTPRRAATPAVALRSGRSRARTSRLADHRRVAIPFLPSRGPGPRVPAAATVTEPLYSAYTYYSTTTTWWLARLRYGTTRSPMVHSPLFFAGTDRAVQDQCQARRRMPHGRPRSTARVRGGRSPRANIRTRQRGARLPLDALTGPVRPPAATQTSGTPRGHARPPSTSIDASLLPCDSTPSTIRSTLLLLYCDLPPCSVRSFHLNSRQSQSRHLTARRATATVVVPRVHPRRTWSWRLQST